MTPLLIVFAKRPEPGRVKTRLCPPFTPEQAAAFYACLLADVLDEMARVAPSLGLGLRIALDPPEAVDAPGLELPATYERRAQRGPDLSARMQHAFEEAAAEGHGPILLRGSDSPALDHDTLAAALGALESHDVVLCPDLDGGYNLVGQNEPTPGLFEHAMSTGSVLDDTCANARARGKRVHRLDPGFDVDTAEDLRRLQHSPVAMRICSRTSAYLDRHSLWPS